MSCGGTGATRGEGVLGGCAARLLHGVMGGDGGGASRRCEQATAVARHGCEQAAAVCTSGRWSRRRICYSR